MTQKRITPHIPMMNLLARTIIVCAIPKIIDGAWDLFFHPEKPVQKKLKARKIKKEQKTIIDVEEVPAPKVEHDIPLAHQAEQAERFRKSYKTKAEEPAPSKPKTSLGNGVGISEGSMASRFRRQWGTKQTRSGHDYDPAKWDWTPFTKEHYDHAVKLRAAWVLYNKQNPKDRLPLQVLTDQLNLDFRMNKAKCSYSKFWTKGSYGVKRKDLPKAVEPLPFTQLAAREILDEFQPIETIINQARP